jgi:amino acid adenylation domain-containing protein
MRNESLQTRLAKLTPQQRQQLIDQMKQAKNNSATVAVTKLKQKPEQNLPLSNAQQRIWVFEKFNGSSAAYNIVSAIRFVGDLDVNAMQWAFGQIVNRHEVMRTRFFDNDESVEQIVVDTVKTEITQVDCPELEFEGNRDVLDQRIIELSQVDFDLTTLPLFKLSLLKLNDGSAVLLFVMHHILADGWSLRLLEQDLSQYYLAYTKGNTISAKAAKNQYQDYVQWQTQWLQSPSFDRQVQFWQDRLQDAPTLLPLPTLTERSETLSMDASSLVFELDDSLMQSLNAYVEKSSQKNGVSLFMLLMASFKLTLAHIAGVNDIVLGTPIANRKRKQFEDIIGLFANTLAIRSLPHSQKTFSDYIEEVRKATLGAFSNHDLPFEKVVEGVVTDRTGAHSPLFQVLFALQASEDSDLKLGNTTIEPMHLKRPLIEFDLILELYLTGQSNTAVLSYRTELYGRAFIEALQHSFVVLTERLLAAPDVAMNQHFAALEDQLLIEAPDQQKTSVQQNAIAQWQPQNATLSFEGHCTRLIDVQNQSKAMAGGIKLLALTSEKPLIISTENALESCILMLAMQAGGLNHGFAQDMRQVKLLRVAGVRFIVVMKDTASEASGSFTVCQFADIQPADASVNAEIENLQPKAQLWLCKGNRAFAMSAAQLAKSAECFAALFTSQKLVGETLLLSPAVSIELQMSALYSAIINQCNVVIGNEHNQPHAFVLNPEQAPSQSQLPANLKQLIFAAGDLNTLPNYAGVNTAVCFTDITLGGVFAYQQNDCFVVRDDLQKATVTNLKGDVVGKNIPGLLQLQNKVTGLTATLNEGISTVGLATGGTVWNNGHLCDLPSIAAQLSRLQFISNAHVLKHQGKLVAYVQLNRQVDEAGIRQKASKRIEAQAMPNAFVIVSHIPLTNNGQVDSKALLELPVLDGLNFELMGSEENPVSINWSQQNQGLIKVNTANDNLKMLTGTSHNTLPSNANSVDAVIYGGALPANRPFENLNEMMANAAKHFPQQTLTHILDVHGQSVCINYQDLYQQALSVAGALSAQQFKAKDIIMLQLADNHSLTIAFWGCVLAGVVPIVGAAGTYQPDDAESLKIQQVCESIDIAGILSCSKTHTAILGHDAMQQLPCRFVCMDELTFDGEFDSLSTPLFTPLFTPHQPDTHDTALMVLTSGSTGMSKAVMQSHNALLARTQGEVTAFDFSQDDVSFNWMPMDHVGGLIMHHITYLYLGAKQVHCPTSVVLEEPLLWLQWLSKYKASTTWAPNFAYALVNERFKELASQGNTLLNEKGLNEKDWNLGAMRFLYNGGEAVVAAVAREFAANLTGYGMPAGTLKPVWGMSETCSGSIVNTEYDPQAALENQDFVNVGQPLPGANVRIVDINDKVMSEGTSGRLQMSGDLITQGYRNDPQASKDGFTEDGWFCTGDLAQIVDGRITITGREKDLIIVNGKNYHCQEIESIVDVLPQVLTAHVIASAIRMPGDVTDKLAIFYTPAQEGDIASLIQKSVVTKIGLVVSYVIEINAEQFPRTSIGKIQRAPLMAAFEQGEFNDGFQDLGAMQQLPAWFYQPSWQVKQVSPVMTEAQVVLVIGADEDLNTIMAECHDNIVHVKTQPKRGWHELLINMIVNYASIKVVYAAPLSWTADVSQLTELAATEQDNELLPLVQLGKVIDSFVLEPVHAQLQIELQVLTLGAYQQGLTTANNPLQSMINGMVKSMALELPQLSISQVDLDDNWQQNSHMLSQELSQNTEDSVVALRGEKRLVQTLVAADKQALSSQLREYKSAGFHLVIGGLGGIGGRFVESLLKDDKAQVLVVGRSACTDEKREAAFAKFSQYGEQFAYQQADMCDSQALAKVISDFEQQWDKSLTHVFNFAGQHNAAMIADIEEHNLLAQISTKLLGPVAIQAALVKSKAQNYQSVEQVHIGSVNGYLGGEALSLYAAANSFLNGWCEHLAQQNIKATCLQYSMWEETGLSEGFQFKAQTLAQGFNVLTPKQGLMSLRLLANSDWQPSWVIGVNPSEIKMADAVSGPLKPMRQLVAVESLTATYVDDFGTGLTIASADEQAAPLDDRPLTEVESRLAAVWSKLLKIDNDLNAGDDFFTLGGNSLNLTRLVNVIREQFDVNLDMQSVFNASQLHQLATAIEGQESGQYKKITALTRSGFEVSSFPQHRVWFIDQMQGGSAEYNILAGVRIKGVLDSGLIEQSLTQLSERHSILRTTYGDQNGQCMQNVHDSVAIDIETLDLTSVADKEASIQHQMQRQMGLCFDLVKGPIFRVSLLVLSDNAQGDNEHVLLFAMHHIASDGYSMAILNRDFMAIYQGLLNKADPQLPPMPIQYADYAQWQREYQQGENFAEQSGYWRQQLADLPPLNNLALDNPRGANRSTAGKSLITSIDAKLTKQVNDLAKQHKATLFMVLHSAFSVMLARRSNDTDIVMGTPIAGRDHPDLEQLIGFFINTLVLRNQVTPEQNFAGLLADSKQMILDAFANQNVAFDTLVDELSPDRSVSHLPLVQVMFALQNFETHELELPNLSLSGVDTPLSSVRFDLELMITEKADKLEISWNYATALFNDETIGRMAAGFATLLGAIVNDVKAPVYQLPIMAEAELDTVNQLGHTVLSEQMQTVPLGVSGTLHANGKSTSERVRLTSKGQLEMLGQRSYIRGFAVELALLNQRIAKADLVAQVVTVIDEKNNLIAYVVSTIDDDTGVDIAVKQQLKDLLPDYLVPAGMVCLAELPLDDNGNVDYAALPTVEVITDAFVAAQSEMELALEKIWGAILMLERISINANFFELGGNSLSATRLSIEVEMTYGKELPIKAVFEHATIAQMAKFLDGDTAGIEVVVIKKAQEQADDSQPLVLSYAQQQLWFINKSGESNSQYNVPYVLNIEGALDVDVLTRAMTTVVERHQVLRTTYNTVEGVPYQQVNTVDSVPVSFVDMRTQGVTVESTIVKDIIEIETEQPFDLATDLMIRVKLIQLTQTQHVLMVTLHHVASDGWSVNILGEEFSQLYRAYAKGLANPLAELPIQYSDFSTWQKDTMQSEAWQEQLGYWTDKLKTAPKVHSLPLDYARPAKQNFAANLIEANTDSHLLEALNQMAKAQDVTLFMLLQSAFSVLLSRYSGETDIVMAVPTAGREMQQVLPLIGCFTNTVTLRNDLSGNPSFASLLQQCKAETLASFEHANVPFEQVVEQLNPERSQAYSPVSQIKFVLQNHYQDTLSMDGLSISPVTSDDSGFNQLHFDLDLSIFEDDGKGNSEAGLRLFLGFKKELFTTDNMQGFVDSYLQLLRALVVSPQATVTDLALSSKEQQQALATNAMGLTSTKGREGRIERQFDHMAELHPNSIAVCGDGESLTYAQLQQKSNRVAAYLQANGVGQGDWVMVYQKRSASLLASLLGTLKAGAGYVPVDPANAKARMQVIEQDAKPKMIITTSELNDEVNNALPVLLIDQNELAEFAQTKVSQSDDLNASAYVIYTSGSTGRPKGVEISHRALADYCAYGANNYYRTVTDGAVLATSHSFDLAVPSLFLPLMQGHQVNIFSVNNEIADFAKLMSEQSGSSYLIRLTPMHLRALMDLLPQGQQNEGRHVFVIGGEGFPVDLAKALQAAFPQAQVFNHYGPSEATVGCSIFDVTANLDKLDHLEGTVPIGRPMENTQLYVMDGNGQLCPAGMPGELYIGGLCLAEGYLHQPAMTEERFVVDTLNANSFEDRGLLYRSGDRVRYLADGNLEYLGRTDDQVKIRGYRVEPGEIKAAVAALDGVKDAYVSVFGEGENKSLAAYVTGDVEPDSEVLLATLKQQLPEFMVPACIIYLASLPLNDNGKVDKRALPNPLDIEPQYEAVIEAPQTAIEQQVAQIWADILKIEVATIGLNSDFYALGGQSLLAMRLVATLRSKLDSAVTISEFFENKTLGQLSRLIEAQQAVDDLQFDDGEVLDDEELEITL